MYRTPFMLAHDGTIYVDRQADAAEYFLGDAVWVGSGWQRSALLHHYSTCPVTLHTDNSRGETSG